MNNMNSGYDGYSMSIRAVAAYDTGEMPLSKWTKTDIINAIIKYAHDNKINFSIAKLKKLKATDLKNLVLVYSSWHHTSSYVNRTDFYSLDTDRLDNLTDQCIDQLIDESESIQKVDTKKCVFRGEIHYLEWSGTRNHPKAKEKVLKDVNIEQRGCFFYISDDNGTELLKKKIDSKGTVVINYKEQEEKRKAEKQRSDNMRKLSSPKALKFYDSMKEKEYSNSNHIYPVGRKPSKWDYNGGLHKFFKVGENRLFQEFDTGILHLETWTGTEWIREDWNE